MFITPNGTNSEGMQDDPIHFFLPICNLNTQIYIYIYIYIYTYIYIYISGVRDIGKMLQFVTMVVKVLAI